jgi:hypothetical protein
MSVEDIRKAELCIAKNNLEHRRNATGSVSRFPVLESLDLSLGLAVIETVLERDRFFVNGDVCFLVSVPSCVYGFCGVAHLAVCEGTQELGGMGFARPLCADTSRIPGNLV